MMTRLWSGLGELGAVWSSERKSQEPTKVATKERLDQSERAECKRLGRQRDFKAGLNQERKQGTGETNTPTGDGAPSNADELLKYSQTQMHLSTPAPGSRGGPPAGTPSAGTLRTFGMMSTTAPHTRTQAPTPPHCCHLGKDPQPLCGTRRT